jgi:hypothetical protein
MRRRTRWSGAIALLVLGGALVGAPLGSAAAPVTTAPVPPGFFGVVPQAPLSGVDLARMEGVVGTLRIPIYWSDAEPRQGVYDFAKVDVAIGAAAEHGIAVLPFIYGTPAWLSDDPARPPLRSAAGRAAWPRFLAKLVERYGPAGEFWQGRPQRMPIRRWQIWNEPNFSLFWRPHPAPRQYAELLALAAGAIRAADPAAQLVLGGVAPVGGGFLPWVFLRRLYRVPGVKSNFDLVALHPYSVRIGNTAAQVRLARQAMDEAGDAKTPILISELGVASTGSIPSAFIQGPQGQAEFLRRAFALFLAKRREWRIAGVDWFTWRDEPNPDIHCGFCQGAGLLDLDGFPKPAWWAYRAATRVK